MKELIKQSWNKFKASGATKTLSKYTIRSAVRHSSSQLQFMPVVQPAKSMAISDRQSVMNPAAIRIRTAAARAHLTGSGSACLRKRCRLLRW